jgi:hypothetical protein
MGADEGMLLSGSLAASAALCLAVLLQLLLRRRKICDDVSLPPPPAVLLHCVAAATTASSSRCAVVLRCCRRRAARCAAVIVSPPPLVGSLIDEEGELEKMKQGKEGETPGEPSSSEEDSGEDSEDEDEKEKAPGKKQKKKPTKRAGRPPADLYDTSAFNDGSYLPHLVQCEDGGKVREFLSVHPETMVKNSVHEIPLCVLFVERLAHLLRIPSTSALSGRASSVR